MTTVTQIEDSIRALPLPSFLELLHWMESRHDEVLCQKHDGYESPELEAAMLKALDGPRQPITEELYEGIRQRWREKRAGKIPATLQPC